MIRKATENDILKIAKTYDELLIYEKENENHSNWQLGIYPTIKVPELRVPLGEMYVLENENNEICASMILNQVQAKEYSTIPWKYLADDDNLLVIHTLCIPPQEAGKGYGTKMIDYAKNFAKDLNYPVIRIDTYAYNEPAKSLYQKNGFRIAGYATSLLEGLIPEEQAYLEFKF